MFRSPTWSKAVADTAPYLSTDFILRQFFAGFLFRIEKISKAVFEGLSKGSKSLFEACLKSRHFSRRTVAAALFWMA
jgi:hypothetical protein